MYTGPALFQRGRRPVPGLGRTIDLRKKLLPLRRGRQTLHHISGDGVTFGLPHRLGDRMRSLVSWSRLFIDQEVLIAMNTDEAQPVTAYSTVAQQFVSREPVSSDLLVRPEACFATSAELDRGK